MASLLSPNRSGRPTGRQGADVRLTATKPTESDQDEAGQTGTGLPSGPRYGWQLVAIGGALTSALAGWIIVSGLSVVGWLAAALTGAATDMADAFRIGTRLWLLANGTPTELGSVHWTLVPLGLSLLTAFMVSRFARAAARFAAPEPISGRGRILLGIVGLITVGYAAVVAVVGLGTGAQIGRGIIGAALIAAIGSAWGASRALDLRLTDQLPGWARALPTAVAAAIGVLLLSGAVVLAAGIVLHADRIGALAGGLGAGAIGGIALWAAQAAFLPNLIGWGASYALGAGFRIGQGSVVAPSDVTLGLLPSIPILGALPGTGGGPDAGQLWLISGVLAGALASWLVVRRRPAARFDETALVGGLAGVLAALVFTGLSWTTGGDLGAGRLAGAGPRMLELLVMSGTLLGLSGMICGLALGLVRWGRARSAIRGNDSAAAGGDVTNTDVRDDADAEATDRIDPGADEPTTVVPDNTETKPDEDTETKPDEDTETKPDEDTETKPDEDTETKPDESVVDEADEPTNVVVKDADAEPVRVEDRRSA